MESKKHEPSAKDQKNIVEFPLCDICTGNIKNKKDEKGIFKIFICTYHLELLETNEVAFNAEVREILTNA